MTDSNEAAGFLRIDNPDDPVYRIFPLWFLEEALRLKQLILVQPTLWEDPYELLTERVAVVDKSITPWRKIFLEDHLRPAYAQAWSRTRESDTLLRAYSRVVKDSHFGRNTCPREEGVCVRSTARKLLNVLRTWCATDADRTCFIGSVQYLPREDLLQYVANLVGSRGPGFLSVDKPRAELRLLKRREYSHEAEVRLIYVEERDGAAENLVRVPFEPNDVFEDISFDPRLLTFETNERQAVIRSLGYRGPSRRRICISEPCSSCPSPIPQHESALRHAAANTSNKELRKRV